MSGDSFERVRRNQWYYIYVRLDRCWQNLHHAWRLLSRYKYREYSI